MKTDVIGEKKVNDSLSEIENERSKSLRKILIIFLVYVLILASIYVVNNVIFMKVEISGPSMMNTLQDGDIILANRTKKPTYGDIIIISGESSSRDENGEQCLIIKRVIAMGGDTVAIEDGKVYLKKKGESNFSLLKEDYTKTQDQTYYQITDMLRHEWFIPEGEIFYMGDNRTNSSDSRRDKDSDGYYWTCKESQVEAVVCEWSLSLRGVNSFFGRLNSGKKTNG